MSKYSGIANSFYYSAELLRRAAALYDRDGSPLPQLSSFAWRRGFYSGGVWMSEVLKLLKPGNAMVLNENIPFQRYGFIKYGVCLALALLLCGVAALVGLPWWGQFLLFPAVFYVCEVQMLFLFPVAIDGDPRPFRQAQRLMLQHVGTYRALCTVLPLVAVMLFGGIFGQGYVRSWSLGCLAVLFWYSDVCELSLCEARI